MVDIINTEQCEVEFEEHCAYNPETQCVTVLESECKETITEVCEEFTEEVCTQSTEVVEHHTVEYHQPAPAQVVPYNVINQPIAQQSPTPLYGMYSKWMWIF